MIWWRYLCLDTTNLVFKESEFVNLSAFDKETKRNERKLFVDIMCRWISVFTGEFIDSFELYLSDLEGFEKEIISLIEFATSKRVKNLVLDFSDTISKKDSAIDHLHKLIYYQTHGLDISRLVFNLLYVENLTICSFLLQMIQDCDNPKELHEPMKTKHLVMKTNMHTNEFGGISIFLNCCPELESLTFDMLTTELIVRPSLPFDSETYWLTNKTYDCLEKTLKVVEVKNFRGRPNELHVLQYLIRTGLVMERLDLYEAKGLNDNERRLVLAGAEEVQRKFKRGSSHLRITLHNA
ncbi:unnamed protein product [Arabis nemorensis]|uniref:FBD domain-containing protein n=1 Tax=Arabis nemorensis TaxID=586526 RepID=A0A565C9S6_9BRAS|nr:unnamed protein product [Arabis nemorensis]